MTARIAADEVFNRVQAGETRAAIADSIGLSRNRVAQIYNGEVKRRALAAKAREADWRTLKPNDVPDLSVRTRNFLYNCEFKTMGELIPAFSDGTLWNIARTGWDRTRDGGSPNFGRKSYEELSAWLVARGVNDPRKNSLVANLEARLQQAQEEIARLQEQEAALLKRLGQ